MSRKDFSNKLKLAAASSKVKSMLPSKDYTAETSNPPAMDRGTPDLTDPSMNRGTQKIKSPAKKRGTPKLNIDTGEDAEQYLRNKLKNIK